MSDSVSRGRSESGAILRWGMAILSVLTAWLANRLIPNGMFAAPFFVAAVMVSAHFGGIGPAVLAFCFAGLVLDYYYIPPFHSFAIRSDVFPSLLQFIVPSAVGTWFVEKRKN